MELLDLIKYGEKSGYYLCTISKEPYVLWIDVPSPDMSIAELLKMERERFWAQDLTGKLFLQNITLDSLGRSYYNLESYLEQRKNEIINKWRIKYLGQTGNTYLWSEREKKENEVIATEYKKWLYCYTPIIGSMGNKLGEKLMKKFRESPKSDIFDTLSKSCEENESEWFETEAAKFVVSQLKDLV
jgi:hypothetical protein